VTKQVDVATVAATDKVHRHFSISVDGEHIGYYMQNDNPARAVGHNWVFECEHPDYQYFNAKTRAELLEVLFKQVNKQPVILKQHFGILTPINGAKLTKKS
jgi:hypothetical protein